MIGYFIPSIILFAIAIFIFGYATKQKQNNPQPLQMTQLTDKQFNELRERFSRIMALVMAIMFTITAIFLWYLLFRY